MRRNNRVAFSADELKGDFEVCVFWVGGNFFDSGFSYIAGEGFLYISYAVIYIFRPTLGEHLNSAIEQVADEAG